MGIIINYKRYGATKLKPRVQRGCTDDQ